MSTGKSPLRVLRAQALVMAKHIKAAPDDGKPTVTASIIMEDRTVKVEVKREDIAKLQVHALADYLVQFMRDHDGSGPPFKKVVH